MTFDSNRAWGDAIQSVRANREVLLALGGVFFLLPALLSSVFLSDIQQQMMQNLDNEEALSALFSDHAGSIFGIGLIGLVVQVIGYVSVMALLAHRGRPTVGEAISGGLRALPTLIGVGVICLLGLMLGSTLLAFVVGALFGLVGAAGLGAVVMFGVTMLAGLYLAVRLSLVMPAVIMDGITSPIGALARSWKLTDGNSMRLLGFYCLLMIGYMVIASIVTLFVAGPVILVAGQGAVANFVTGLVSGVIGAVASILLAAIIVQTHRQLAGSGHADILDTFE